MNMSRMTPGRFYRLLRDVYGRKSLLTCGVLAGGSVIGTANGRRTRPHMLDDSALRECHESRGTRCSERHSAQIGRVSTVLHNAHKAPLKSARDRLSICSAYHRVAPTRAPGREA